MKKLLLFISVLLGFVLVFSACSKKDTYADKLKKERNAINRFINDHDIDVIHSIPEDSVFAENQYYKDNNTGVYFRVENWGKGDTIKARSDVYLRVANENVFLVAKDTIAGNMGSSTEVVTFKYGIQTSYTESTNYYSMAYYVLSPACVLLLKYGLRNGGVVSMIVPFTSGSTYQQSYYEPIYMPEVNYTFYND